MSTLLLSENHINTLVTYAAHREVKYFIDGQWNEVNGFECMLADYLLRINEDMFKQRYSTDVHTHGQYEPVKNIKSISPVQIIKAAQCYEYNCDDWSLWEQSTAKAFIEALINSATYILPGYDDAQWAIA